VAAVNLFFVLNLLVFFLFGIRGVRVGVPFFLWLGIFNVTLVAQFWAFANDIYTEEQGRRLFGVVGIGSSVGAVAGAHLAGALFVRLGPFRLMMVAALILILCLVLMLLTHRREASRGLVRGHSPEAPGVEDGGKALRLLLDDRYLLLIAAVTLLFNSVNSTGEYILDRRLLEQVASGAAPEAQQFIAGFRASFYGWVNLASLLLQSFLVSRVMQRLGVHVALLVTPIASAGGYALMALVPRLTVTAAAKAVEDSLAYSFMTTGLHSLFLITSRAAKYRAKTAVDTVFWRAGDLLSAGLVLLGSSLRLSLTGFAWINFTMALLWITVMVGVSRLHGRRSSLAGALGT
jgi:AAA family ATP:ADP antiporter